MSVMTLFNEESEREGVEEIEVRISRLKLDLLSKAVMSLIEKTAVYNNSKNM